MPDITEVAGKVNRIFVETSDVVTSVRLTLMGDRTIYHAETRNPFVRLILELTAPGDDICFETEAGSWMFKVASLTLFSNMTLNNEVN